MSEGTLMKAIIAKTGHPLAAQAFTNTVNAIQLLAQVLAPQADEEQTVAFTEQMMRGVSIIPDEMNKIAADPSFIIALAAMLRESLAQYVMNAKSQPLTTIVD